MASCKQCKNMNNCADDAFVNGAKFDPECSAKYCTGFEPITNADRIRAITDEELAKFLDNVSIRCPRPSITEDCSMPGGCEKCVLSWLQQPAKGDCK